MKVRGVATLKTKDDGAIGADTPDEIGGALLQFCGHRKGNGAVSGNVNGGQRDFLPGGHANNRSDIQRRRGEIVFQLEVGVLSGFRSPVGGSLFDLPDGCRLCGLAGPVSREDVECQRDNKE